MTTSGIDLVEKHVHILHWDNCFFLPIWLQNSGACYTTQHAICLYVRYRADTINGLSLSNITKGDNSKSKKGRVVILVGNTSSGPVLHFCQVSSKYSKGYLSYRADTKSFSNTTKGDNSKSKKARVVNLVCDTSSRPDLHFYQVSSKYSKGYSCYLNTFWDILLTRSKCLELQMATAVSFSWNSLKNKSSNLHINPNQHILFQDPSLSTFRDIFLTR